MSVDWLHQAAAGGAALAAGTINALAGGGTLVSFPALVGLGLPAVDANITNTVSLLPGYLAGSWAQRDDLRPQLWRARVLALVSAAGGVAGSVLLVVLPARDFRVAVPYLVLLSCALLALNDRLRRLVTARNPPVTPDGADPAGPSGRLSQVPLVAAVFAGAVYGGYFGAGLGIMLLAILGLFLSETLTSLNALKQALSFVANLVAALFFVFSGHVVWRLVPVMAVASMAGGLAGGRLARVIDARLLRALVVVAGVAVAIGFWVG